MDTNDKARPGYGEDSGDNRYSSSHVRPSGDGNTSYSSLRNRSSSSRPEINGAYILRLILLRWRLMLLLLILGGLSGAVYLRYADRIYEAKAVLEMNATRPRVINNSAVIEDVGSSRDTDSIFHTRFQKFQSPAMEELAVREFYKRYPESSDQGYPGGISRYTLARYIHSAEWRKDPDANIVFVSYESPHPVFAAHLVNVLAKCAGLLMLEDNKAVSDDAVRWLVSQEEEQRESLERVERQLAEMRAEVKLDALQQNKEALGKAMSSVSEERETLVSTLNERKAILAFITNLGSKVADLEVLPSGLPKEDQLHELIQTWRDAHDELIVVSERYTEIHPDYRLAEAKEGRAKERLEQFIETSKKSIENELNLLQEQVVQVDDRIAQMKVDALELEQEIGQGLRRVQQLERKRDAADNAYKSLLKRMEDARSAADDNMAFAKVIREAQIPYIAVRPRRIMVMLVSIFAALLIGVLVVFVHDFMSDTVGTVSDLRSNNLNVIGIVPSQKKMGERSELATVGLRDKFNPVVEVFAGIQALLSSRKYSSQTKMLVFCSALPGEGKTVSACNFAISSALHGTRTLLIDGDLRRPQLRNIFAIDENHPSLLEWLMNGSGSTQHEDLVCRNVIDNLDLIPSRPLGDVNPSSLLGRGRLESLFNWARARYDRVIIDSPPLGLVGDALALAIRADGVILVSRIGKTRRRALRFALASLEDVDVTLIGCIANDVPHALAGMFGGSAEYGYGYTYGYSSYHA